MKIGFKINKFAYLTRAYCHLSSYLTLRDSTGSKSNSYFNRLLVANFSCSNSFPNNLPSFFNGIFGIIQNSAQKQMVRSNTFSIVALVAHKILSGVFFKINKPRCSMRKPASTMYGEISISRFVRTSNPHPALSQVSHVGRDRAILVHLFPKALTQRFETLFIWIAPKFGLCHYLGRFFHTNSMTEFSRFWSSITSDGVFIMSKANGGVKQCR